MSQSQSKINEAAEDLTFMGVDEGEEEQQTPSGEEPGGKEEASPKNTDEEAGGIQTPEPEDDDESGDDESDKGEGEEEDSSGDGAGDDEEEESEEEPAEVIKTLQSTLEQTLAIVQEQAALIQTLRPAEQKAESETAPPIKLEEVKFVENEEQLAKLFESPDTFNKMLNNVLLKGVALGREIAQRDLPVTIANTMKQQQDRQTEVKTFYETNPDLFAIRTFVGFKAKELAQQNPTKDRAWLMKVLPDVVRAELKMPKPAKKGKPEPAANKQAAAKKIFGSPGGGGGGGAKKVPSNKKMTQAELDVRDLFD